MRKSGDKGRNVTGWRENLKAQVPSSKQTAKKKLKKGKRGFEVFWLEICLELGALDLRFPSLYES